MNTSTSDTIIWDSFRQGNKDALALLFKRHYAELFRYGLKIAGDSDLVNDALQDLFIEIWHQKSPAPVVSIKAYLLKSLRYKLLKAVKSVHGLPSFIKAPEDVFDIGHEAFLIQSEQDKENVDKVLAAIQQLPPRQKEIIYLRFYLNLSYQEICAVMHIEYQVARNQMSTALKNMKRELVKLLMTLMIFG